MFDTIYVEIVTICQTCSHLIYSWRLILFLKELEAYISIRIDESAKKRLAGNPLLNPRAHMLLLQ
jgi:hypothetical protein